MLLTVDDLVAKFYKDKLLVYGEGGIPLNKFWLTMTYPEIGDQNIVVISVGEYYGVECIELSYDDGIRHIKLDVIQPLVSGLYLQYPDNPLLYS